MSKNKKGIELSLNMIILTIIALLILMIMIFFIVKYVKSTNDSTACKNNKGECISVSESCSDSMPIPSPLSCPKGEKCCTNLGGLGDEPAAT